MYRKDMKTIVLLINMFYQSKSYFILNLILLIEIEKKLWLNYVINIYDFMIFIYCQ